MLVGLDAARSGSSSTFVYLGGIPEGISYSPEDTLCWSRPAWTPLRTDELHAAIERHGRLTGCAGIHFTPNATSGSLRVEIAVASVPSNAARVPGLPPWAAQGLLAGIRRTEHLGTIAALGPGLLRVQWGWWHQVDSSEWAFSELGERLLPLLLLPRTASQDDVTRAWVTQQNEHDPGVAEGKPSRSEPHS